MPRGPKGEKRPADVIGNTVHVMRIATGEIEDAKMDPGKEYARAARLKGGPARAAKMSPEQRSAVPTQNSESQEILEFLRHSEF